MKSIIAEQEKALRDIIQNTKDAYMKSPTYVLLEAAWNDRIGQINEKAVHKNWWDEFSGDVENTGFATTYYSDIEDRFCALLREDEQVEDDLEVAEAVLPRFIKEYAIPDAHELKESLEIGHSTCV